MVLKIIICVSENFFSTASLMKIINQQYSFQFFHKHFYSLQLSFRKCPYVILSQKIPAIITLKKKPGPITQPTSNKEGILKAQKANVKWDVKKTNVNNTGKTKTKNKPKHIN